MSSRQEESSECDRDRHIPALLQFDLGLLTLKPKKLPVVTHQSNQLHGIAGRYLTSQFLAETSESVGLAVAVTL